MKCNVCLIFGLIMIYSSLCLAQTAEGTESTKSFYQRNLDEYTALVQEKYKKQAEAATQQQLAQIKQNQSVYDTQAKQASQLRQQQYAATRAARLKVLQTKQQSQDEKTKELEEKAEKIMGQKSETEKAQDSVGSGSLCDCYDSSSPYNYPSNFIYNHEHARVRRISPFCRCKMSETAVTAAELPTVSTTPTRVQPALTPQRVIIKTTQPTQTQKPTSLWQIDYN